MNKLNNYLNAIKNSRPVKYFIDKTETTFNTIKSNSLYTVVLMALIVDILLIPFNTGLRILEKLIGGFFDIGSYMGVSAFDMIENLYYMFMYSSPSTMEIVQIVGFFVVTTIVTIVGFLLVNFYLPNGALHSFNIYVTEGRVVKIKEFSKLTKLNIKEYSKTLITVVAIPLILIKIAGKLINYVPFVAGISLSNLIIKIFKYALLFKMYSILLGVNGEEEMQNKASDWLTYAIFMYILERTTTLGLVIKAFNIIFILFTILSINSDFQNGNINIDSNNNLNESNIKKDITINSINEYSNTSISKVEDADNNTVINNRMNILKESKSVIENDALSIEEDIISIKEEDILYTGNATISNNSSKSGISLEGRILNNSSNTAKSGLNLSNLSSNSNSNITLSRNNANTINSTNNINSSVEDSLKIDESFLDEDFIFKFNDFDK